MGGLDGRRALVTGGGRGLGAAVARALAAEGAAVTVSGRTAADLEAVAADVGGGALVADVADRAGWLAALDRLGPIDVLVANAGVVWPLRSFALTDLEEWEQAVAINLLGAVRAVRVLLPGMLERGWGRIVTISSGAADPPGMPVASAYSTGKAALDMFTLHLAGELDGSGVTALALRPGVVDTPMQTFMRSLPREQVGAAFHDRFHGLHERGELLAPQTAAEWIVGQVLSGATGTVVDIRTDR